MSQPRMRFSGIELSPPPSNRRSSYNSPSSSSKASKTSTNDHSSHTSSTSVQAMDEDKPPATVTGSGRKRMVSVDLPQLSAKRSRPSFPSSQSSSSLAAVPAAAPAQEPGLEAASRSSPKPKVTYASRDRATSNSPLKEASGSRTLLFEPSPFVDLEPQAASKPLPSPVQPKLPLPSTVTTAAPPRHAAPVAAAGPSKQQLAVPKKAVKESTPSEAGSTAEVRRPGLSTRQGAQPIRCHHDGTTHDPTQVLLIRCQNKAKPMARSKPAKSAEEGKEADKPAGPSFGSCSSVYCEKCLEKDYGVDADEIAGDPEKKKAWICFGCKGTCTCAKCTSKAKAAAEAAAAAAAFALKPAVLKKVKKEKKAKAPGAGSDSDLTDIDDLPTPAPSPVRHSPRRASESLPPVAGAVPTKKKGVARGPKTVPAPCYELVFAAAESKESTKMTPTLDSDTIVTSLHLREFVLRFHNLSTLLSKTTNAVVLALGDMDVADFWTTHDGSQGHLNPYEGSHKVLLSGLIEMLDGEKEAFGPDTAKETQEIIDQITWDVGKNTSSRTSLKSDSCWWWARELLRHEGGRGGWGVQQPLETTADDMDEDEEDEEMDELEDSDAESDYMVDDGSRTRSGAVIKPKPKVVKKKAAKPPSANMVRLQKVASRQKGRRFSPKEKLEILCGIIELLYSSECVRGELSWGLDDEAKIRGDLRRKRGAANEATNDAKAELSEVKELAKAKADTVAAAAAAGSNAPVVETESQEALKAQMLKVKEKVKETAREKELAQLQIRAETYEKLAQTRTRFASAGIDTHGNEYYTLAPVPDTEFPLEDDVRAEHLAWAVIVHGTPFVATTARDSKAPLKPKPANGVPAISITSADKGKGKAVDAVASEAASASPSGSKDQWFVVAQPEEMERLVKYIDTEHKIAKFKVKQARTKAEEDLAGADATSKDKAQAALQAAQRDEGLLRDVADLVAGLNAFASFVSHKKEEALNPGRKTRGSKKSATPVPPPPKAAKRGSRAGSASSTLQVGGTSKERSTTPASSAALSRGTTPAIIIEETASESGAADDSF